MIRTMTDNIATYSAGGLVVKDGQVLVIHWDPPRSSYNFPKGTMEVGESPEITCVREVFEETGYHVKILAHIGQNEFDYVREDGENGHKIVDYYLLELADDAEPTPAREAYETFENVWLDYADALQLLTRDIDKDILQKALKLYSTKELKALY